MDGWSLGIFSKLLFQSLSGEVPKRKEEYLNFLQNQSKINFFPNVNPMNSFSNEKGRSSDKALKKRFKKIKFKPKRNCLNPID